MYFSEPGWYDFQINSDDGSRLFVDNQEVVTYDGLHPAAGYVPGVYWNPTPGAWTMYELQYFEATGLAQLQLERKASTETAYRPVPFHQLRTSVRRKKLIESALLGLAHVLRVFDNEANPLSYYRFTLNCSPEGSTFKSTTLISGKPRILWTLHWISSWPKDLLLALTSNG